MRPIHLGWAALAIAAGLACLWMAVGAPAGSAFARAAEGALEVSGGLEGDAAVLAAREAERRELEARAFPRTPIGEIVPEPAPSVVQAEEARELVGRVVDVEGAPIAGATIAIAPGDHWLKIPLDVETEGIPRWLKVETAVTGADGGFRFEDVDPGPLRLAARARGFARRQIERLVVGSEARATLPDVVLEGGAVLAGRVVDRAGKGVPGTRILLALDGAGGVPFSLPGRGVPLGESGEDGAFLVDELGPGPWRLLFDSGAHVVAELEQRIERPRERHEKLLVRLEAGLDVSGRVVLADAGAPPLPAPLRVTARVAPNAEAQQQPQPGQEAVPSAPGEARPRSETCDGEGTFVLRGLRPGTRYALTLSAPDPDKPGQWKKLTGLQPATAWAGERGVEIAFRHPSALAIRVVDAKSKAPIETFVAAVGTGTPRAVRDDKGEVRRSHPDGRLRMPDLRVQQGRTLALRVSADGYADHEVENVRLAPGEERDLGEIALEPAAKVEVRVVDAKTRQPIAGARVALGERAEDGFAERFRSPPEQDFYGEKALRFGRTGPDGVVALTGAPGKLVTARADARGYLVCEPLEAPLPVQGDAELELALDRGGLLVVRVVDEAGTPVRAMRIAHRAPGDVEDEGDGWGQDGVDATSDDQGVARFEGLVPGSHRFRTIDQEDGWWQRDGGRPAPEWTHATVTKGGESELVLHVPSRGGLAGRVREGGRGLEGARLKLVELRNGEPQDYWGEDGAALATSSSADGSFSFSGLRCGTYHLYVHHEQRRMAARFDVEVEPAPRPRDYELDVASVEGRVTDAAGEPLAGVELSAQLEAEDGRAQAPYQAVVSEDDRGGTRIEHRQISHARAKTDEQGRYRLRGVRSDTPIVVVVAGDLVEAARSKPMTLGRDEERRGVDFALRRAARVVLRFVGDPAPGANAWMMVRLFRVEDPPKEGEQPPAPKPQRPAAQAHVGTWNRTQTLRGLAPGRYRMTIQRQGSRAAAGEETRELELAEGETRTVEVQAR